MSSATITVPASNSTNTNGRIVYATPPVSEFTSIGSLWTAAPDGSSPLQIVSDVDGGGLSPAWSADGKRIVYASWGAPEDPDATRRGLGLYTVSASGGAPRRISPVSPEGEQACDNGPSWAPTGSAIAFESVPVDQRQGLCSTATSVWVMDADGRNRREIATDGAHSPAYNPAGTKVAFVRGANILTMDPDGSNQTIILPMGGQNGAIDWSPDGQRIAFSRYGEESGTWRQSIYVYNTEDHAVQRTGEGISPTWSPDGSLLSFLPPGGPDHVVRVATPDGSAVRTLSLPARDGISVASWGSTDLGAADTEAPAPIQASGPLYDLRDQYVDGQGSSSVAVVAHDASSGVAQLSVEDVGHEVVASQPVPCPGTSCPSDASQTFTVSLDGLTEGLHTFSATASDLDGNVTPVTASAWRLFIDRGSPGTVSGIEAVRDGETSSTSVSWQAPPDAQLQDGSLGSGAATYNYRYRVGSGSFTPWAATPGPAFSASGLNANQVVTAEISAVDLVGNVGAVVAVTDTVAAGDFSIDSPGTVLASDGIEADYSRDPEPSDPYDSDAQDNTLAARGAYSETNCPSSATCGEYDAQAAANYALSWYSRRNPRYASYSNDCANFLSQALKAGGMRFMRTGGENDPYPGTPTFRQKFKTGTASWWSARLDDTVGGYFFHQTQSWTLADVSRSRILENGIGATVSGLQNLRTGDVLYYYFPKGDYPDFSPNDQAWTHASIVTRVTKNGPRVAQHTTDYEKSLANVLRDLTSRFHSPPNQGVWKITAVRPNKTAYNIG